MLDTAPEKIEWAGPGNGAVAKLTPRPGPKSSEVKPKGVADRGGDRLDDGGSRMAGQVRVGPVLRVISQLPGRAGTPASSDHDKALLSVDVVALHNGRLFCRYGWV